MGPVRAGSGRSAIVTGAGRGYWRVVAVHLAEAGFHVGVLGRDRDVLDALAGEVSGSALVADVLDPMALAAACDEFAGAHGLDVLVNNAGVQGPDGLAWETSNSEWWSCLEVNLHGPRNAAAACVPHLIAGGGGCIVNVVSHAGIGRWPLKSAYAVSKAALIKYGETLAAELRRHQVSVVSFHPGMLEIGFADTLRTSPPEPGTPAARVAAWVEGEIAAGRCIDADLSAERLVRLATAGDKRLSGRYFTAYEELEDTMAQIDHGGDAVFTLGLITG